MLVSRAIRSILALVVGMTFCWGTGAGITPAFADGSSDGERDDAVREVILRVLLSPTRTKINVYPPLGGKNNSVWKVYFIAVEIGKDPSARLLQRFEGRRPPVKPVSASFADMKSKDSLTYAVKEKKSKRIGILFWVGKFQWLNRHRVQVQAGYYSGGLYAFAARFTVVREGGRWRIKCVDNLIMA